jgi:L-threonylcarbamoyladenylate synthase
LARQLLQRSGIPLAAPSANPFGYISPTTAAHVRDGLGRKIAAILDGGPCTVGVESTILDLTNPHRPRVLRPGSITAASLENALGIKLAKAPGPAAPRTRGLLAPGMLSQHYSPRTRLLIKTRWDHLPEKVAAILLRKPSGRTAPRIYWLSTNASLAEIARNLYQVLRRADQGGYREIWLEQLPNDESGLAAAINDRVHRAAAKR